LGKFVFGPGEADLQAFDLTEPALAAGLVDPGQQVVVNLEEAWALVGIRAQ